MKTNYAISIPKPCHQDWSKMTVNEKGRFCQSCSTTVVDFTKMPKAAIEDYLAANKSKNTCGRFNVSQIEHIRIKIPERIILQETSFQKLFILALLIAMGTSLLNCSDQNGTTKKIDAVEVISTLEAKTIQMPEITASKIVIDSTKTITIPKLPSPVKKIDPPVPTLTGLVVEVMGEIALVEPVENDEDLVIGFMYVDHVPQFIDSKNALSKSENKDDFAKRISQFVSDNFDIDQGDLGIKGKQRIYTKFTIDKKGDVIDIKIRGPHPQLEKEAFRVIKLLPQFIPGQQGGRNVAVTYTLPIIFVVADS